MIESNDYHLSERDADTEPLNGDAILEDYRLCCLSRALSVLARREVLTGKAKFATTDDGKELLQVAMARAFRRGDFRADYYRGHTLLLALGLATVEELLAQLYADPEGDPFSAGRQMFNHHATPLVDGRGAWTAHTKHFNISSDISTTAGQMARALGLALASKKYRELPHLAGGRFSDNGREVCFCNIGDGSTAEGAFWETLNAAGLLEVPLLVSVWDDGYGISVPSEYQCVKGSISEAIQGLQRKAGSNGIELFRVAGWDYPALCEAYRVGGRLAREEHIPVLLHVQGLTQPQGHSTSGSHERYKSKERLQWEHEHDCNRRFRQWILENGYADAEELEALEAAAEEEVKAARHRAWSKVARPRRTERQALRRHLLACRAASRRPAIVSEALATLDALHEPVLADLLRLARRLLFRLRGERHAARAALEEWAQQRQRRLQRHYGSDLYDDSPRSALDVPVVPPRYEADSPLVNGYEVINAFFDRAFERYPNLIAFGEDVGRIGDVNQGLAGLQTKYGEVRLFDTGIREWTIVGQAIGMAMRGLRPIAEIQYLDYLLYGLSPLADDLATLRYRSAGRQIAPAIIRTRGHRLEGIWHSGSPLGLILNALRGLYVLVPRNFTQAAGMYNTLLQGTDPALLIECLNAYRLKERLPANIGDYNVPLGVPEVLQAGRDLTLVTYGACVRVAQEALPLLAAEGIEVELIDVQTLLPFDREQRLLVSLKKTNRLLVLDEDVPGGASAFILREVLEVQGGYRYLDSPPRTLTAAAHRPPYGSDGDYFAKPNAEDVAEVVFTMLYEAEPTRFDGPPHRATI